MHPADMILFWGKADPERLAIIRPDMTISYRAVAAAVWSVSERIRSLNIGTDTPVAVSIEDPGRYLVVCFALLRNGIPAAPTDPLTIPQLIASGIDTLIGDASSPVLAGGRNIRFDDSWMPRAGSLAATWDMRPSLAINTNLVFFTSGTTGTPKKTITPSSALMERVAVLPVTGEGHGSRILILPGLNSAFGFTRAAVRLHAGMTSCFAGSYQAQARLISTFNIDTIIGSPQQILGLIEHVEQNAGHRFESVRDVRIGGGYASPDLVRRVQARLSHAVTTEYGATETGLIAFARRDRVSGMPDAVGFPAPGVELEIVDETNAPLPIGSEGLVRCRTAHFLKSLADNNPDRASDIDHIWWYPGDIGHLTEDGVLCIAGRADDVINFGGVKVSALELDDVVKRHPGVRDGAVCGVRGRSGLEEVWVGVTVSSGADIAALKTKLENWEIPLTVGEAIVLDEIPRNQLGKLQRHRLKALLLGAKARSS